MADPNEFAAYVQHVIADAAPDAVGVPGYRPATHLWFVDGSEYFGRLTIRHRPTPEVLELHGHIGYDVRPTARRKRYATVMLEQSLPIARSLGIETAVICCDVENVGSRCVIEANGGVGVNRGDTMRYELQTSSLSDASSSRPSSQ